MPVQEFFEDQLAQMREFMDEPGRPVRVLAVDEDLKPVLVKMLSGLDNDPNTPHVLIPSDAAFRSPRQFFASLMADVLASYEASAEELLEAGVYEPFGPNDLTHDPPEKRVTLYLSALAESLPDHIGSVVVVLAPQEVTNPEGYREALGWLADNTWSQWVKFLVVDDRVDPKAVVPNDPHPLVETQTFYLPPEELERRLRDAVFHDGSLAPNVRRQYTGMLGGFALSRGDFELAATCYEQQAELTQLDKVPAEEAQAHYCLGNVRMQQGDYAAAEESYGRALELSMAQGQPELTGLVLTQLGTALHRQDRGELAAEAFAAARDTAAAADLTPLVALSLDAEAECFRAAGDDREAERCWKEALAIYDRLDGEAVADIRETGRADVLAKLDELSGDIRTRPLRVDGCCPPATRRGA